METPETAMCRYVRIAASIADAARRLHECRNAAGESIPACTPVGWTGSTESLALSMLTVALHESGLREDIQNGIPPLGRGAAGEACLVQVRPQLAVRYASWLAPAERARVEGDRIESERFAQTLLGNSAQALERCFQVGGAMLARARRACEASSVPWDHGMFSMYGSGASCNSPRVGASRKRTFSLLVAESRRSKRVRPGTCQGEP